MTRIVKICVVGIVLFFLPSYGSSLTLPFFHNAPRALFDLAASASASASQPSTPFSNIADLRRAKDKAAQLQEEKHLTEQDEMFLENSHSEDGDGADSGDDTSNEASPSLLQKKIGKILTKLRLLAQLKNAVHYKPETFDENNNTKPEESENLRENYSNEDQNQNAEDTNLVPTVKHIQHIPAAIYGSPKAQVSEKIVTNGAEPIKIDLEVNKVDSKLENLGPKPSEKLNEEPGRIGNIGVFFAELLGSIVGLTYGALAQITSGGQSPVTISTSESI